MYRCVAAAALGVAVFVAPASAQGMRPFPQNALRGALVVTDPPQVTMNGVGAQLAPGARIRNQANLLEMSGALIGQRLLVNYTIDGGGQIRDVWILRADEAAVQPWPTTLDQTQTWSFDPIAQVWVKP